MPTSAESFVKGDDGEELIELRAGEAELRGEQLLLRLEHFVIGSLAGGVTCGGKFHGGVQLDDFIGLTVRNLDQFLARHKRIRDVLKGVEDSLMILKGGFVAGGFALVILADEAAAFEDGA